MSTSPSLSTSSSTALKDTLPRDFTSGLVVALVALPLCLGVALASNAPLISGLTAGIVGGLVVSWLSGSHTSVSGPAAGLTAVVATQIATLGSFNAFLSAVIAAGVMQVLLGLARAGSLAGFFPSSVIKGLLAAIGVILILKQIPHLFGHDPDWLGDMSFQQQDGENTFTELLATWFDIHPGASLIGLASVALLYIWPRTPLKRSPLPSQLIVVIGASLAALAMKPLGGVWLISESHLVSVPSAPSLVALFGELPRPELGALTRMDVWVAGLTLCVVASLETLLNLEAVDKIDPKGRTSPPNRELLAQGVGNITSGLLGALPVTSVIVRSSVNISSGGETRVASFIHGVLLLLAVGLFPFALNQIPLACLAAVLIVTGFKLASPKLFMSMWREGWTQFTPFIITVSAIVLTDLLKGIIIGLLTSIVFILHSNLSRTVKVHINQSGEGEELLRFELGTHVSFLNRATLHTALSEVPQGAHVIIDARKCEYIDGDVLDMITDFEQETARARSLIVSLIGFEQGKLAAKKVDQGDRRQFKVTPSQTLQQSLSPQEIFERLREGHDRYLQGSSLQNDLQEQVQETASAQYPLAVILACMDSRVSPERIFDLGIGEAFVVRVAGNIITPEALGSVEYGCALAGAKLVVVLGHTRCGAISAALDPKRGEAEHGCQHIDSILTNISAVIEADEAHADRFEGEGYADHISAQNALSSVSALTAQSDALQGRLESGELSILGAVYDVRKGEVSWLSEPTVD